MKWTMNGIVFEGTPTEYKEITENMQKEKLPIKIDGDMIEYDTLIKDIETDDKDISSNNTIFMSESGKHYTRAELRFIKRCIVEGKSITYIRKAFPKRTRKAVIETIWKMSRHKKRHYKRKDPTLYNESRKRLTEIHKIRHLIQEKHPEVSYKRAQREAMKIYDDIKKKSQ